MSLLARLREGDATAFGALVDRYAAPMLRVARLYVPSDAVAQEVVQETWLAVLQGLDAFEERSSLTTWLFRILVNRARTRGEREARTVPFATLAARECAEPYAAVDPDRFLPADDASRPPHWATPPRRWDDLPERHLDARETADLVREALALLPPMQRIVMIMRDLEGWEPPDVCAALEISDGNQRVLLHRARSRVRACLEPHMAEDRL
ncbi:MAG: hypothetical protein QOG77_427 [Solirubrobacteraceae bacterium]|nr:hypothetical protein [Solirubrobacteraceae bacterium]